MKKMALFPLLLSFLALTGCASPGQALLVGVMVYGIADCAVQRANRSREGRGRERERQPQPQPQYLVHRTVSPSYPESEAPPAPATGSSADAQLQLGLSAYREFRYADCAQEMTRVIDDPSSSSDTRATAYIYRGAARFLLGDEDRARQDFRAAHGLGGRMDVNVFRPDIVDLYGRCAGESI